MAESKTQTPLRRTGFPALLATMTCGALNDNLLRGALLLSVVAGGMWGGDLGEGGTGWITAMLYFPFILLLGLTGQLADRYSKKKVIIWTRIAEVLLAIGVTVGFALQNLWVLCVLFLLLASQSAFFSPAKYGAVPELVDDRDLSRANGILGMLTNMAILTGVGMAGFVLERGPVFVGLLMIVIAICGLVSALRLPPCAPAAPSLPVTARTFSAHVRVVRHMKRTPLLSAAFAWCWFYGVGSLIIAIVPAWKGPMELSDAATSALLAAPGVGIGVGGLVAGFGSGNRILPALIPVGAIGMTVTFLALGLSHPGFGLAFGLLVVCGIFAGFYLIPILSLLQHLPTPAFRARVLGTANFMTYVAMSTSAIIFALVAPVTSNDPELWFLICAVAMALVSIRSLMQHGTMRKGAVSDAFATIGPTS